MVFLARTRSGLPVKRILKYSSFYSMIIHIYLAGDGPLHQFKPLQLVVILFKADLPACSGKRSHCHDLNHIKV